MYLRVQLLLLFASASLFFPSPAGSLLRVDDGLLILLFLLCIPRGIPTGKGRQLLVLTLALIGALLFIGFVPSGPLPFGFQSTTSSQLKEAGRLIKLGLMCFTSVTVLTAIDAKLRRILARGFLVLLTLHSAFGLAQYLQVPFAIQLTETWYPSAEQAYALTGSAVEQARFRAVGSVYNPNIYGFAGLLLGFLVYQSGALKARGLSLPIVSAGFSIAISQSRTAIVSSLVGVAISFLGSRRGVRFRRQTLVGVVIIAVFGLLFASFSPTRFEAGMSFSTNRPQYTWLPPLVLDHSPILGFGIGTSWFLPPDSDFLYALIQVGTLGTLLLALYYLAALLLGRGNPAMQAAVAMAVLGGLTNGVFFGNELAPFVQMLFALALSREQQLATST